MKSKNPHNIDVTPLQDWEKAALKSKIYKSVNQNLFRKKMLWYSVGVAASISLLLSYAFYINGAVSPSIRDFAKSSESVNKRGSDKITLILSEGENLKIDEDMAAINYSSSGKTVTLGVVKEVDQKVAKNDQIVFNTLFVPYGKRSKIQLSDGTTIWLNSGSKMIYPVVFNDDRREVYLEGEAIFDVTHDKDHPFVVLSEDHEIEVLGTVFCVTNYLDESSINTVLKSGSVQISYFKDSSPKNGDKMKITPGTLASYNKKFRSIKSEKVNVDNYFSWREGVLIFKNNNLSYIMKRLSRFYNINISISDEILINETFSGYLDLNEDLDIVIQNINESTNIDFVFVNNEILLNH